MLQMFASCPHILHFLKRKMKFLSWGKKILYHMQSSCRFGFLELVPQVRLAWFVVLPFPAVSPTLQMPSIGMSMCPIVKRTGMQTLP